MEFVQLEKNGVMMVCIYFLENKS